MKKISYLLVLFFISILGCTKESEWNPTFTKQSAHEMNGRVVIDWNEMFLVISANITGYRAPVAARVLGYMNWAGYEAVAPGMEKYQSIAKNYPTILLPQINPDIEYHWGVAANAAYYEAIKAYVPKMDIPRKRMADSLNDIYIKSYSIFCDTATRNRSIRFGQAVAKAIVEYSRTDGGANVYLNNKPPDYKPPVGEDKWARMFPDFLAALTPYWGSVRPIAIDVNEVKFIDPIPFSKDTLSDFYKQVHEVFLAKKNATKDELWQGDFWSDDIQFWTFDTASRFISIANQVLKMKNANLEEAAYTNAKVGMALFDGSIVCWKEKYTYNLLRPVTYIRNYIDPTWVTNLNDFVKNTENSMGVTPAHPSYPSGHSTFGEAASVVLTDIFGENFAFTDISHKKRKDMLGMPRSFKSFDEMSKENAYSRIPLGVHYRMDCDEGLRIGRIVGEKINKMPWKKYKPII